jgi:hypothetical protein
VPDDRGAPRGRGPLAALVTAVADVPLSVHHTLYGSPVHVLAPDAVVFPQSPWLVVEWDAGTETWGVTVRERTRERRPDSR